MKTKPVLDLRFNGRLDHESNILFNNISNNLKNEFNSLITDLSIPNKDNIDWWVSELPSRNTSASPFYHYLCCVHLIHCLVQDSSFNFKRIIVDTLEMKKLVQEIIKKNNTINSTVEIKNSVRKKLKKLLIDYFGDLYMLNYNILKWFIAKLSRDSNRQILPNRSLVLIDTFVIPGYTNTKRWYGSLWENLNDELKNETYFVSTIIRTSLFKLFSIYKDIRSNDENYIIKEDYIHFIDFFFAFRYKQRVKSFKMKKVKILNFDITGIINECMSNPRDIFSIYESLLTYRFFFRLKQKKIKVRLSIDWFEGQINDKAWSAGFHKFYPGIMTYAYRAFESYPLYLCSYPIQIEKKAGVIPKVFALQGAKTVKSVKEFMPDLDTILIPAYKSEHVFNMANQSNRFKSNTIIVSLPISIKVSSYIISIIKDVCNNKIYQKNNYRFIIKPHPANSVKIVYPLRLETLPPNILFTAEKSFPALLYSANVLITEASSTCLEAIAVGVPVILFKRNDGLFHSPLPEGIDEDLFKICSSGDELKDALNSYLFMSDTDRIKLIVKGNVVKGNYFQPITKEGTNRFMNVKQVRNHIHA